MVKYLRGRSISDWRAVFLRKGTLSLILAGIIAFQGVFLCSCKRSDTGYTKTIGTYDGKPIEWIYISHGEHTSILISKYILDVKQYDTSGTAVNWDSSSIRKWLNEDFYNQAFTDSEKEMLVPTTSGNRDPILITTDAFGNERIDYPDNDYGDKVFLLSAYQAQECFDTDNARAAKPSEDSKDKFSSSDDKEKRSWWLAPSGDTCVPAFVDELGRVTVSEQVSADETFGIRPAIVMTSSMFDYKKKEINKALTDPTPTPTPDPRYSALADAQTVNYGTWKGNEIDWVVLDEKGEYTLLMSKYAICAQQYHQKDVNSSWETCDLKSWLNSEFYNSAFYGESYQIVSPSEVRKGLPDGCSSWAGMDAGSKVFLLTQKEIEEFIPNQYDRVCKAGRYTDLFDLYLDSDGFCNYWLRSDNFDQVTEWVDGYGSITTEFNYYEWVGVRPCIWVKF